MSGTLELQEIISRAISSIQDGYAQIVVFVIDSALGDHADYQIDYRLRG